jgi:DNA-binding SARP family transcriptional activator
MNFRILGPLEVEGDKGLVRIGGRRGRSVLALLLLRVNQLVSRGQLIEELWGECPPATARHTLEAYVSRLRQALAAGANGSLIESQPGGYRICLEEDQLDVFRFERLLKEGRSELDGGALEAAEEKLAAALALWRGPVLADLADELSSESESQRLEELRLAAVEARVEVALQLGRDAELVGELQSLVASNPLRERLRAQLMLALYRSGRQADALAAYRDGRRQLVDELGIEPSRELQELEQAILRHDWELESPATLAEAPVAAATDREITAAPPEAALPERRKIVTVAFCDVMGSMAPDERLDPEVLKASLESAFARMKATAELHGGTIERVTGNAVMATFGVPVAHEDDALRACRAAVELQRRLPELGLQGRIGVSSGEVLTGGSESLAIGETVAVAARLQQAAEPGEVLLAAPTLEFAGVSIEVEPADPLTLAADAEPVPAYRLLAVAEGEAPGPPIELRFVGREPELALLREVWGRVLAEQRCELVTILGEAGIGKSRLVAEALGSLEARVVQSRCLPYGDGITYWPAVEVVGQLEARPPDPVAAAAIRSLLGETDHAASAGEIAWAFRKLLAHEAPLVVVFDDLHRAEETFLDLVEAIALFSSDAPLLVLCMARPELSTKRPDWPVTLRLEPLTDEQVLELIGDRVSAEVRERVARAAGGNPLFVVELLAMAERIFDGEVPATLQALLAARLDQLDEPERSVLEHAAVEGEVFHRGAVQALTQQEPQLTHRLAALLRGGVIRPAPAQIPGEDAFRFSHLLLCNAAYEALPKTTRVELHQRFATWLEEQRLAPVERDQILGYHLAEAADYLQELGSPDPALAERAGEKLAAAGRSALWRDDRRSAASLLERALALTRPTRLDIYLELDLADAVGWLDPLRAVALAEAAAQRAHDAGDTPGEALARVVTARYRSASGDIGPHEVEALAYEALPLLEKTDDHAGLVHVWGALAHPVAGARLRCEDVAEAAEQQLRHARLAGQRGEQRILDELAFALVNGPRSAGEALQTLDERLSEHPSPNTLLRRAMLLAMLGRFREARQLATEAGAQAREFASFDPDDTLAAVATLAGDHETAAQHLRRLCDHLEERGGRGWLSGYAPMLGRELCALGRYDEAEPLAQKGRELGDPEDAFSQMAPRQTQALVHSHRGRHAEAETLAREAVEIGERTDALNMQGDALCDLAQVLEAAGRPAEAAVVLEEALDRYERKQNLAMVHQVQPRLEALRALPTGQAAAPALSRRSAPE